MQGCSFLLDTIYLTQLGGKSRKVLHLQFTSWPDHGVPEYAGPSLTYLRRVKAETKAAKGPAIFHCRLVTYYVFSMFGSCVCCDFLNKWKNKMKGDVGMSRHEKERKQEDAYTKTQTHS